MESKFYPLNEFSESDLEIYGKKLKCLDNDELLDLWGNYDLSQASNLMVVLE